MIPRPHNLGFCFKATASTHKEFYGLTFAPQTIPASPAVFMIKGAPYGALFCLSTNQELLWQTKYSNNTTENYTNMAISYLAAGANTTADSLVIPVSNLSGFNTFDKFDGENDNLAFSRFLQGFLEKTLKTFTDNEVFTLGFTITKDLDDLAATSQDVILSVWNITFQRLIRFSQSVIALPVPTGGSSAGVGDFALAEIFPDVEKVASGSPVTANSVVIPVSDLTPYGSPTFANINIAVGQDNRDLWNSVIVWAIDTASLRSLTVESAITAKSINSPTIPTLAAALTQETNPTSGINSEDLFGKSFVSSQQFSISIQLKLNFDSNTHDVNFA